MAHQNLRAPAALLESRCTVQHLWSQLARPISGSVASINSLQPLPNPEHLNGRNGRPVWSSCQKSVNGGPCETLTNPHVHVFSPSTAAVQRKAFWKRQQLRAVKAETLESPPTGVSAVCGRVYALLECGWDGLEAGGSRRSREGDADTVQMG
ncbi:hypothetical protein K402DRAFT_192185 [Aulographum hederae CBS 113979]|uniref:Uncharacterized protein n=1 Tax=Aulographum hederae CBS 113979 TaxID=1176131 RepID=A0A6G1GPE8_9PEZI|nr:hypothetical protein K402DRAFT_192185 [Aulographum hederae CBS 113979]